MRGSELKIRGEDEPANYTDWERQERKEENSRISLLKAREGAILDEDHGQ